MIHSPPNATYDYRQFHLNGGSTGASRFW